MRSSPADRECPQSISEGASIWRENIAQKTYHWSYSAEISESIAEWYRGSRFPGSYSSEQKRQDRHADGANARAFELRAVLAFANDQGLRVEAHWWEQPDQRQLQRVIDTLVISGDPADIAVFDELAGGANVSEALRRTRHSVAMNQHNHAGSVGIQAEHYHGSARK